MSIKQSNQIKVFFKKGILFYGIAILLIILDFLQKPFNFEEIPLLLEEIVYTNFLLFCLLIYIFSILETLFVVSFYFPGSLILAIIIFSFKNDLSIILLASIIIWLGINTGTILNYIIGLKLHLEDEIFES